MTKISPWFVGRDRCELNGSTFVSKFDDNSVSFDLTFQFTPTGKLPSIKLEKEDGNAEESDDRKLNRAYRSLVAARIETLNNRRDAKIDTLRSADAEKVAK